MQLKNMRINPDGAIPHGLRLRYPWIFIVVIVIGLGGCGEEKPQVNKAPLIEITYPLDQAVFNQDDQITFASMGGDEEDGSLIDESLTWTSSVDGTIGIGVSLTRAGLSPGTHSITITASDSQGAKTSDSLTIEIKPTTSSHPIVNGSKTTGVRQPQNAFDGNRLTAARITRSRSETDQSDYLHFVAFVGSDERFSFQISTDASTPGSIMVIEGERRSGQWEGIYRYTLDKMVEKIITITDAQKYVDENGHISLRARCIGESDATDTSIFEITRKPSPTTSTTLTSKVIIIDL